MKTLILLTMLILETLVLPHGATAADYTIIQQNSCNGLTEPEPCAFPSSVTAGDSLVCIVFGVGIQFPSTDCSDNLNGTYSSAVSAGPDSNTGLTILYKLNVLGGSTTASCFGSSFDGFLCSIFEIRGQPSFTSGLDQTNSGTSPSATSISTGSITTTHASEIMFSAAFKDTAPSAPGWSNSAGWTQIATNYNSGSGGFAVVIDDQIVTSTGSYSNTLTATGSTGRMAGVIASFVFGASMSGATHRAQVY